jgi:hypothetical protein
MIAREKNANTIIASNVMLIILGLGVIKYIQTLLYTGTTLRNSLMFLFMLVFEISIFMLIRKGFVWFKYFMLILTIFGMISLIMPHSKTANHDLFNGVISIAISLLNVVIVVFMFLKPKSTEETNAIY